jgi:hypothetical protein
MVMMKSIWMDGRLPMECGAGMLVYVCVVLSVDRCTTIYSIPRPRRSRSRTEARPNPARRPCSHRRAEGDRRHGESKGRVDVVKNA